jgi:NAD(P)H-dependent FMN reductase
MTIKMSKLAVIYGSYRQDRQGIKAAQFIMELGKQRGHEMTLVDARYYDLPILDRMYKEMESPSENMEQLATIIKESDGFIFVSGEYNHSVQPGLKNLIDHFLEEWFWKPSGIISYSAGGFGGVRAGVSLRPILAEVGTPTIPSMLAVSKIGDFNPHEAPEYVLNSANKFFDELVWYVDACKAQKVHGTPY